MQTHGFLARCILAVHRASGVPVSARRCMEHPERGSVAAGLLRLHSVVGHVIVSVNCLSPLCMVRLWMVLVPLCIVLRTVVDSSSGCALSCCALSGGRSNEFRHPGVPASPWHAMATILLISVAPTGRLCIGGADAAATASGGAATCIINCANVDYKFPATVPRHTIF